MPNVQVNARVRKRREAMRRAGLWPVQIWVPDTRPPGFATKCRHQCQLVSQADEADTFLRQLASESAANVEGWME